MRGTKKGLLGLLSTLAVLVAALAVATPAFAATITINQSESGHSYSAYQILDGDVTEESGHTNVRLSNVTWGKDIDGTNLLNALKDTSKAGSTQVYAATSKGGAKTNVTLATLYQNCNNATDFAAIFDWASDNTALADTIAGIINTKSYNIIKSDANPTTSQWVDGSGGTAGHYTLTINDPGYYFIGDGSSTDTAFYTNHYFLQIFNDDKSVAPKVSTPTVEKKVYENTKYHNEANNEYGTGFNDTADYSIGDYVPFKLIGTIPEMSAYNNGYQYQFVDTLSTSLTCPESVTVYLAKNKDDVTIGSDGNFTTVAANVKDVTSQFSKTNGENNSMTIAVNVTGSTSVAGANDLTQVDGIYNKDDNGQIITNQDGSKQRSDYNYIIVVYKAQLTADAATGQGTISGNTLGTQHKNGSPAVGNVNVARLDYSNNPNTPSGHGSTDNDYVIVFTYTVELTKASASNTSTTLSGATFQLKNGDKYAKVNATTHKFVAWVDDAITGTDSDGNTTTLTSGSDGKFSVIGLDDGTYTLHETKAPDSYNTAGGDWTIVVSANTSNGQEGNGAENELASIAVDLTGGTKAVSYGSSTLVGTSQNLVADDSVASEVSTGKITATITNTQGFQLPQTGDMGTSLLVIGGLAIAGVAIIVLAVRMRANDER